MGHVQSLAPDNVAYRDLDLWCRVRSTGLDRGVVTGQDTGQDTTLDTGHHQPTLLAAR
jgi:hypothetical protein